MNRFFIKFFEITLVVVMDIVLIFIHLFRTVHCVIAHSNF